MNEEKTKKKSVIGKIFGTIGIAFLFGVVSAATFYGSIKTVNKFVKRNEPQKVESQADIEELVNKAVEEKLKNNSVKVDKPEVINPEKAIVNPFDGVERPEDDDYSVREVVEIAMPSIVAITNKSVQEVMSFYSGRIQQYESQSAGSGIIVGKNDNELLIVTNAHVVDGANTLSVCFVDETACPATVKGSDSINDIAVIAVGLSDIPGSTLDEISVATIGDSDKLNIGEQVVAIGNALGYGQSVTTGIVSALNRSIQGEPNGNAYVQTDAAINPGNSGGALLNMDGELVGINSAKLANTKIEGMGYAIPISAAYPIMEDLMNMTTRELLDEANSGYLGISGFSVTDEVSQAYGIPKGIYISQTTEGSAADRAGIQKGDVIAKFDGIAIDSITKLKERLRYYRPGEEVELEIYRADEGEYKNKTVTAKLDNREKAGIDSPGQDEQSDAQNNQSQGAPSDGGNAPDNGNGENSNESQRNGEFNIGGSTFKYSLPNNIFDIFGR